MTDPIGPFPTRAHAEQLAGGYMVPVPHGDTWWLEPARERAVRCHTRGCRGTAESTLSTFCGRCRNLSPAGRVASADRVGRPGAGSTVPSAVSEHGLPPVTDLTSVTP